MPVLEFLEEIRQYNLVKTSLGSSLCNGGVIIWSMQIKSLEAELKKQDAQEKMLKNGEEVNATESFLQLVRNYSLLSNINVSSVFIT